MGIINRRQLRIKVLQSLYAFQQSENVSSASVEKSLFKSVDKVHELYITLLLLLVELKNVAKEKQAERALKHIPTQEDLNPNKRFVENKVLELLETNADLIAYTKVYRINWRLDDTLVRKLYAQIIEKPNYQQYMESTWNTMVEQFSQDRKFIASLIREDILDFEMLQGYLEDHSIEWQDDFELVCVAVLNTVRDFKIDSGTLQGLTPLYNDEEIDKGYTEKLFRNAISYYDEHLDLIDAKTDKWEIERIALIDKLVINLALTEARLFSEIPTKVTMNEYLEVVKLFSTAKSHIFVNGVLDKLFKELTAKKLIVKFGLGLK